MTTRVVAVVLTFDAPDALDQCLLAIRAQNTPVSSIIVIDNASARPVDVPAGSGTATKVLRMPDNLGPAGGYAAGLQEFLESDGSWAWMMDDDCVPAPDALNAELAEAASEEVVLATMIDRETGEVTNTQGWCGVLVPRSVVAAVGVPNAELFWWTEDTEYLQWRIPRAGFEVVRSSAARITVSRGRETAAKPAWKYYYEARNQVFYRLTTQRVLVRPLAPHLKLRVRAWRATWAVLKLATRAVVREREQRSTKFVMVWRGALDGLRRRLGRTVMVDDSHRPSAGEASMS
jgi:rhamnopyranosyl-N-acetylglucosaminyl-diphospho-decaprenol beta-1,3/1,4-galactofuranosyltransferase